MQIHVASAAVIRRKMKNGINPLHRRTRHSRFAQIRLQKFHFPGSQILANVSDMSAGQVIDDAYLCRTALYEVIRQRRADKRRSTRHENRLPLPKSIRSCHARCAS
jgi:hypothetical protein